MTSHQAVIALNALFQPRQQHISARRIVTRAMMGANNADSARAIAAQNPGNKRLIS